MSTKISKKTKVLKKEKGFTLIEILVALSIFLTLSVLLVGAFVTIVTSQEKIMDRSKQLFEINFALSYIHNKIANSKNPPVGSTCIAVNTNIESITRGIRFVNQENRCQEIFFDVTEKVIKTRISNDDNIPSVVWSLEEDLTSSIIEALNFSLSGQQIYPYDRLQPKVIISIVSSADSLGTFLNIERTVSRIKLDN